MPGQLPGYARVWLCTAIGFLPLLIDDLRSQNPISGLVMLLYNGAYEGTISRGGNKPSCMAIITVIESEKYVHNLFYLPLHVHFYRYAY